MVWELFYNIALSSKILKMGEAVKTDIRDDVMGWLKDNERSIMWLSNKTGIEYNSLYAILKIKTTQLSKERVSAINKVLGTKFTK